VTMHPIDRMAAIMAEIDNATAAQILRQLVNTVQYVHQNDGPELTTAAEFAVAASHVPAARKIQELLEQQEWDTEHVEAFIRDEGLTENRVDFRTTIVTDKNGVEHTGRDLRMAIRAYKDHKEALSVKAKADFLAGGWKKEATPVA
jgi:hypothetical protein